MCFVPSRVGVGERRQRPREKDRPHQSLHKSLNGWKIVFSFQSGENPPVFTASCSLTLLLQPAAASHWLIPAAPQQYSANGRQGAGLNTPIKQHWRRSEAQWESEGRRGNLDGSGASEAGLENWQVRNSLRASQLVSHGRVRDAATETNRRICVLPKCYKEMSSILGFLCWPIAPSYMSRNARGGGELRGLSQWVQLYTGAQINFGDVTQYLTYGVKWRRLHLTPTYPVCQSFQAHTDHGVEAS